MNSTPDVHPVNPAPDKFDVIIIGAGPAGLSAAEVLATFELSVCLIDEQVGPGGQIWRNACPVPQWSDIEYHPASTVIDVSLPVINDIFSKRPYSQHSDESKRLNDLSPVSVTWLQNAGGNRRMRQSHCTALIIATGAMERPLLFPGSHLSGVMGVGAVQSALKQARLVPRGEGIVLAGQGPLLMLTLQQITAHGASVDAVLDLSSKGSYLRSATQAPRAMISNPALLLQGLKLQNGMRRLGIPVWKNITALEAVGDEKIEALHFITNGKSRTLPVRLLAIHDGVMPNTQLTRLLNLDHEWSYAQQCFSPVTNINGQSSHLQVWVSGDSAGIAGAELAVQRGRLTGLLVANFIQTEKTESPIKNYHTRINGLQRSINVSMPARDFIDTLFAPLPITMFANDETIICRCEAVSMKSVRQAIAQGAIGPNRIKTFTRCGMGACQGRQCGNALTRILKTQLGHDENTIGALRIRPPLKPTLIADYLSMGSTSDKGIDKQRDDGVEVDRNVKTRITDESSISLHDGSSNQGPLK